MAGNATVTLTDGSNTTTYEIWIQMFSTSTANEFSNQQVRNAMTWIPIRRAEMRANFTAIWPLKSTSNSIQLGFESVDPSDGFAKMNLFQDALRAHHMAMMNGAATPMVFHYYNNSDPSSPIYNKLISQTPLDSLEYSGWIQQVEKQYIRFQNVFTTQYSMNIITKNVANTPATSGPGIANIVYPPTIADQAQFGQSWLDVSILAQASAQISGLPSGNA